MSKYPKQLALMMEGILGKKDAVPSLFRGTPDFPASAKLAVYRDAYRQRLHKVITSSYPASAHYLGDAAFAKLAGDFITHHPSRDFNLDHYPIAFGSFLANHTDDLRVCDLAALESAMAYVYHAEEIASLAPGWITTQTEQSLAASHLTLPPATTLLHLRYPVNEYLNAFRKGSSIDLTSPHENYLLVSRHKHELHRLPLSAGEYCLLILLDGTRTLANALESREFSTYSEKALQSGEILQWFSRWTEKGCLCLKS